MILNLCRAFIDKAAVARARNMNEFAYMKFRQPRTDEQLKRISHVRTGRPHKPHKKHVWKEGHSEDTKMKISKSLAGRKSSDETRAKLSAARKGTTLSEETKRKISAAQKKRLAERKKVGPAN